MIVEGGIVKAINVEDSVLACGVTSAEALVA